MSRLLLILLLSASCHASATVPLVRAELSRNYGLVIGDLLQQRIALGTPATPLVLSGLPPGGRIGNSLWRRSAMVDIDAAGQHWLQLDYQIINTPQTLTVWSLPALTLTAGTDRLAVAGMPFSIAPFTPLQALNAVALPALQPDQAPAPVALAPITLRIQLAASALLATLLVWGSMAGWRYLRRGRHLPFARAMRDLQALHTHADTSDPLAAQRRLHHALNDAAGEVVRPATLARLLASSPYLLSEKKALADFLDQSQAVFFGSRPVPDATTVTALARRLRRLEQRHAA
ncbi:calcium incorporation protein MxaA [Actimicrobium sp. CCC2.4]|uniref:calcium incorporation protein MxaA n=1 Tax=Actimicrobium sp. CCC2.4 TaxID=3048606 RepID=UPI002AC90731|nr:calcium incorporation protein MxaA [Actimicrobium sp. CCC2.4]MEB0135294.1 calcium incorporation protein MxaA [Actimicrobium sp. CCC2.4]WPX31084.1 calcium incorporation protein MxaA [Actimicrobium sp. CCC2.4]